jgi:hypothetical protein
MNLLSSMLALWSAISAVGLTCAALIVLAELRSDADARGEEPAPCVQQAQGTPAGLHRVEILVPPQPAFTARKSPCPSTRS